jgi:hypothetical protein
LNASRAFNDDACGFVCHSATVARHEDSGEAEHAQVPRAPWPPDDSPPPADPFYMMASCSSLQWTKYSVWIVLYICSYMVTRLSGSGLQCSSSAKRLSNTWEIIRSTRFGFIIIIIITVFHSCLEQYVHDLRIPVYFPI